MKRVGFQFKVRQDRLKEYKEHHQHVWPEMLEALHASGWHNYSLFMRPDGLIFGYFETRNINRIEVPTSSTLLISIFPL